MIKGLTKMFKIWAIWEMYDLLKDYYITDYLSKSKHKANIIFIKFFVSFILLNSVFGKKKDLKKKFINK